MGNRNSSNSKVHGKARTRVASTEPGGYYNTRNGRPIAEFRNEYVGKPNAWQQSNTPLDNDETFTSFIRRAKYNMRTVSHIGQEHSNISPAPPQDVTVNAADNQNEEFSNFIVRARKKLRTSSTLRKNGSFKRV